MLSRAFQHPTLLVALLACSGSTLYTLAEPAAAKPANRKPAYKPRANKARAAQAVPAKAAPAKPVAVKAASKPKADPTAPAPAVISATKITGLFYMQKYWIATRYLEKAVWYFAPDGAVYFNPETGFTPADLAAVKDANKGKYSIAGETMSAVWADGRKSEGELEIVPGGFNWDMGMFLPVEPFQEAGQIVGSYEGGTSMTFSGNTAMASKSLTLRADGTFTWEGVVSFNTDGTLTGGESATNGKWTLAGYILTLTAADGNTVRSITFPFDSEDSPLKPDYIFFAGVMYKKKP